MEIIPYRTEIRTEINQHVINDIGTVLFQFSFASYKKIKNITFCRGLPVLANLFPEVVQNVGLVMGSNMGIYRYTVTAAGFTVFLCSVA